MVNFMLKRMGLRMEEGVRNFCAMLQIDFDDLWSRLCVLNEDVQDTDDPARSQREDERMSKAVEGHKPSHLEFENRVNFEGTVMAVRAGLDELVPRDAVVPDDAATLRPASVHGQALAMRAVGLRPCMRKRPVQHKKAARPPVVTVSSALAALLRKDNVHSLAQWAACRKVGCRIGGECRNQAHFIPQRLKADALAAARAATATSMPTKDQIQQLIVSQLKDLCTRVGLPTGGKRADLRARLEEKIDEIQAADAVAPPADSQAAEGVSEGSDAMASDDDMQL